MTRSHDLNRRDWLRLATLGVGAGSVSSWLPAFASDAAAHPERDKSVILLWLDGGPATIDLWDLKPGRENGGPFQEIQTATAGVRISEHLPRLAQWTNEMAIVRSMTSKEGDHGRATQFVKTGYVPQGAIQFPAIGALVAHELNRPALDLPGFVSIHPNRNAATLNGGFLGPKFSPFNIAEGLGRQNAADLADGANALKVPNLEPSPGVSPAAQSNRLALLGDLERRFSTGRKDDVVDSLQSAVTRALRMMQPEAAAAFRLEDEDPKLREAYGKNLFGQGCLLARRLIERGVPFVEVSLTGWDTHQNNFERVKTLCGALDTAFASLLQDLKQRGLLQSTVVVCMGEFGRTPKINGNQGRDHWPNSWASVLAGGALRGGQVVGRTSEDGLAVEERPVTVPDLIATVCKAVGIDPLKQNMSNVGRPIRIADPLAMPIEEIL